MRTQETAPEDGALTAPKHTFPIRRDSNPEPAALNVHAKAAAGCDTPWKLKETRSFACTQLLNEVMRRSFASSNPAGTRSFIKHKIWRALTLSSLRLINLFSPGLVHLSQSEAKLQISKQVWELWQPKLVAFKESIS